MSKRFKTFYSSNYLTQKDPIKFEKVKEASDAGIIPFLQIIDLLGLNQHEILQKMGINNIAEFSVAQLNGFSVEQIMKFCEAVKVHPADMIPRGTSIVDSNLVRALLYVNRSNRYGFYASREATHAIESIMASSLDYEESRLTDKTQIRSIIANIRSTLYNSVVYQEDIYPTRKLPYSFKDWYFAINEDNKRLKDKFNKLSYKSQHMAVHLFGDDAQKIEKILYHLYEKAFLLEHGMSNSLDEDKYIDENISAEARYAEYYDDESDKVYCSYSQIKKKFIEIVHECVSTGIKHNFLEKICEPLREVPDLFKNIDINNEDIINMLDNYYTGVIAYYAADEQLYDWIKSIDIELDLAQTPQNISSMTNLVGWTPPKL